MITSIYPDKDATINSQYYLQNTGQDSIVELSKTVNVSSANYVSRILMKFDLSSISQSISTGVITSPKFYLNLYNSNASEIAYNYTIYAYPISESWEMGLGKDDDYPLTTEGVSWTYRDGENSGTRWTTGSMTGDATGSSINYSGGGTWYTGSVASQSFVYKSADIRMNITSIVNSWFDGTHVNQGIILKYANDYETDNSELGSLKFFSRDTHTKYPPRLEIAWDDSTFSTGSLTPFTEDDNIIVYTRLKKNYNENDKPKIRVYARDRYPVRTYATASEYKTVSKYLPTSSYYSILDAHTEDVIVPFDTSYTKLSCDSNGHYFKFWFDALQPDRYYRLRFKIDYGDVENIVDNNSTFKLIR